MLQVAIIPAAPSDIDSFLQPLLDKLRILQSYGVKATCENGSTYSLKAHLLLMSGDIIGVQQLVKHTGHQSEHGCRRCHIKSVPAISPSVLGYGRYYRGSSSSDEERSSDEFKLGAPVKLI